MIYNRLPVEIGGDRRITLDPISYQYDVQQILMITGDGVPDYYTAEFCNDGDTTVMPMVGTAEGGVAIPNSLLRTGRNVIVYLVITGEGTAVETRYEITIPVNARPLRSDIEPTDDQQLQIDTLVAALNTGVGRAETAAGEAEAASQAIQDMDVDAETLAEGSAASVEKTVDPETGAVTLNFGIPKGDTGATGQQGPQGIQGETGPQGPQGIQGEKGDPFTYEDLTEEQKAELVQGPILDAQTAAVNAVGTTRVAAVNAVNQAGTTQVGNVNRAGTNQVDAVNAAGAAQVQAVENKGDEVLDSIPADYSALTAEVDDLTRQLSDVESAFDNLNNHVRYENENIIAENDIQTTSGVKIDSANSSFAVSIDNGASFRFRVVGTGIINKYALYYSDVTTAGRFSTNLSPNTNYEFIAPVTITSLHIYVGATDVIGSGTLKLVAANVTFNNDSVDKKIADLESSADESSVLIGDKWQFDRSNVTEICVHHDNFSRTMTGWEIGMNAGGTDVGNSYDWVTPDTYDDGLRVDNGATFESGTREYTFSLRKIAEQVSDNFMIETNAPTANFPIEFGFNVTDINNFMFLEIRKNSSGYRFMINPVVNGGFSGAVLDITCVGLGKVISIYCIRGVMYLYLDDTFMCSSFVGQVGNYVYLASLKSYNTHFDFVNVFNVVNKTAWNPNRVLDSGISDIPLKTVSANEGNYELQDTITRWSNYADHMTLHSDDPLIHSGRRCEISIGNMNDYKGNLRHFIISFDVLFPSEYVDTEQGDLFVQTHDRDGTYRGTVPFALYIKDNVINVNTSSTYAPKDDNTSVIIDLYRFDFAEVELGKWHHFEIEIKERYEERQNPFLRIKIDGITQFEYRKANCYNDLLGTSPQYGIYKNNWGTGVTEFQRYFDNFNIEYC